MGGQASKSIASKVARPIKSFNFESRAQKAIEKQKTEPKPAPRHQSTDKMFEKQSTAHPEVREEVEKQDPRLIGRVNELKLEMEYDMPRICSSADRPLPSNRKNFEDPDDAFINVKKIPKGKMSLVQAHTILERHLEDQQKNSAVALAKEYNLDIDNTLNFLRFYSRMNVDVQKAPQKTDSLIEIESITKKKTRSVTKFIDTLFQKKT
ncbi:NADH dehydrogenase [ubiquinone] 1 alpha subcomplex assembly factor 4-like [Mya arenaria]|uniref:NADH dehydrogenase [ubiquinone] 1 alpha subcomplex assembly factor 4-like n=1 Tax=Mya arenaria TaxID=6604 RepID=UPI0022E08B23|nr:NADH dehydrogenase [ubiquinone] 1 alpha subcomplex assembly factor 4-like [Mya arenaria]